MVGESGLSPTARRIADTVAGALPHGPVVIALSGGADSAALAWAVSISGVSGRALSVDHGLAGSSSLMEAARRLAARLELPHRTVEVKSRSASETDLRAARMAALQADLGPGEWIVTGHTRDDQAETVLGNVLRGAGTAGLAGIPESGPQVAHPMLAITRSDARATAEELALPFVDDPQNEDITIRRNRLRVLTIPTLASEYNPQLRDSLARLAAAAGADDAVLEHRAAGVPLVERDGAILIPAASLQTLPVAVASRVVRRALRRIGDGHPGSASDVAAVLAIAAGGRTTIGGGVDVAREGPWVALLVADVAVPDPVLLGVGATVEWGDWSVSATGDPPPIGRFASLVPVGARLIVRAPRAEDRISIGSGTKRVGDALAEAGVPVRLRSRWPLLDSDGRIAWIPGVRAAPVTEPDRLVMVRAARRRT